MYCSIALFWLCAPTFFALVVALSANNNHFLTAQFKSILNKIYETKCVIIRCTYIEFWYAAFLLMVLQELQYQAKPSIQNYLAERLYYWPRIST